MERQDEDLILGYQQGQVEDFNQLFARYKRPVFNFSLRILNNRADAEDVTSEVFMRLHEKRQYYQPQRAKFSTWLFTIAHHCCISQLRRPRPNISLWIRKDNGEEKEWNIPDTQPSVPQEMIRREEGREVRRAIAKLPDQQKEALILREYHQFSYQEIAQIMSCSLEQVKILIFRAREFLRNTLPHLNAEVSDA